MQRRSVIASRPVQYCGRWQDSLSFHITRFGNGGDVEIFRRSCSRYSGIANLLIIPHPVWFSIANVLICLPAEIAGGKAGGMVFEARISRLQQDDRQLPWRLQRKGLTR